MSRSWGLPRDGCSRWRAPGNSRDRRRFDNRPMRANARERLNRHQVGCRWIRLGTTWNAAVTVIFESNRNADAARSSFRVRHRTPGDWPHDVPVFQLIPAHLPDVVDHPGATVCVRQPVLTRSIQGVSSRDARTSVTLAYRGKQPLETRQAPGRSLDPVPVFGAGRLRRPSPSPSPHRPVSRAVENALSGLAHLFQLGAVLPGFRSSFRRARRTGDAVSRWTAEAACGLRALGGRFAASPDVGGARFAATLRTGSPGCKRTTIFDTMRGHQMTGG